MHFSSFSGQVQKIQTEVGMGLISPFGGCSDWGREHLQHWQGPGLAVTAGTGRGQAQLPGDTHTVQGQAQLPGDVHTVLAQDTDLMQSCAKTFPPGLELSEGLVWVRIVQCCRNGESSDSPWL